MKSDMKYVLVKKYEDGSEAIFIIDDPIELFKNGKYDESRGDKLYQLGPEVTVETTIKVTSKPAYRGPESMSITTRGSGSLVNSLALKTEEGYNG